MKRIGTMLLLVILLLSACNTQEADPTATPELAAPTAEPQPTETPEEAPTEAPEEAPTEAPEEAPTEAVKPADQESLTTNDWQWVAFTSPVEQFDVEMAASYQLRFLDDGTIAVVADCNNAFLPYTAEEGSLSVEAGPATLALCPGDSRSEQFVGLLSGAARYFFEDGHLFIDLMADGGTMEFAPVPMLELTSIPWQWLRFTGNSGEYDLDMPANYVLTFNPDGSVEIVADCNNALGEYTDEGGNLEISVGPTTLALCADDSRSEEFIQLLDGAIRYFIDRDNLFIVVEADGGTMSFSAVSESAQPAAGEESGAVGELSADIVAQLDAFLQSQVYSDGGNPELAAPGLVLYVETPDGVYLNAAGVNNLEDSTPMQGDAILEIGSNTKSMTIVLLMQLVEEGLISLDDPLSQYLPDMAALVPNGDQMTIRQLAQHTAGLYDYGDNIIAAGIGDPAALESSFTPVELVQDAIDNGTPYFAPGEEGQWYYSNTGYVLLGMIIESLTGEDVADLYQSRIFDPLEMESAIFLEGVPQPGDIDSYGYWWTEDGEVVDTINWNASQGWVAGAAAMSAEDLATYGKALAAGELFQNPDTLNEMLSFDDASRFGVGGPYGLGLIDFAGDGSIWGHGGQTLGFQSLWYIDPENDIIVVGLTNSATYSANAFLNVRNILQGDGALPLSPITLLPVGDLVSTRWAWTQFSNPEGVTDIDEAAGLRLVINKDQSVLIVSNDCGVANGTYTVNGTGTISFEIDDSTFVCEDEEALGRQFVQYLNEATSWAFINGNLLIELPADSGTMVFTFVPPQ